MGPYDLATRLSGATEIQVVLQKVPKELSAVLLQQSLEISVRHPQDLSARQSIGQLQENAPRPKERVLILDRTCLDLHRGTSRGL
jgi:hypothetical protein